ncbi:cell wall hydrolase [Allosphingosinicella sp.]|jgi:hypothetical protein|uniref:cell wall hydrolase n=1 Tax=Allosphingosinicella sp. TaxID=2823234 RepID=UPI002EEDA2CB
MARPHSKRLGRLAFLAPALLLGASCVPATGAQQPQIAATIFTAPILDADLIDGAPPPPDAAPLPSDTLLGDGAFAANSALGLSGLPNPAASPFVVRGRTALDQMRSLDCLAQAIYYEAGNESEDGQRAVAQVVLNRVRHPSWPNSVCGVVYQGPMRPGGGCQFTFTCDGSLARRPGGAAWFQARRLASDALAGRTYAPVGLSTHYHANYVFPAWAPRLAKTTAIGAHIFYRLPAQWGEPGSFRQAYAGSEPMPRPAMTRLPRTAPQALPTVYAGALPAARRSASVLEVDAIESALPQPQVREQYRNSGMWRTDSPIAPPTGRQGRR